MLSRPSSSAAVLVSPRAPHLLATYAPIPKLPRIPSVEEMLTIAPPPALRIEGTTARVPRYVPVRLMSIHLAPGRQLGLRDYSEVHDARVVDQHGNRAEGILGSGHRCRPALVARDVEAGENRLITNI